jgi:hypothetical protein
MRLALVTLSLDSKRSPDFTRVLNILGLDGFTAQLANRLAKQSIVLLWSAAAAARSAFLMLIRVPTTGKPAIIRLRFDPAS